jgi:hypothetical protein
VKPAVTGHCARCSCCSCWRTVAAVNPAGTATHQTRPSRAGRLRSDPARSAPQQVPHAKPSHREKPTAALGHVAQTLGRGNRDAQLTRRPAPEQGVMPAVRSGGRPARCSRLPLSLLTDKHSPAPAVHRGRLDPGGKHAHSRCRPTPPCRMGRIAASRRDSKSGPAHVRSRTVISAWVKKGFTTSGTEGCSTPWPWGWALGAPLGFDPPEADVQVSVVLLGERVRARAAPAKTRVCARVACLGAVRHIVTEETSPATGRKICNPDRLRTLAGRLTASCHDGRGTAALTVCRQAGTVAALCSATAPATATRKRSSG